MIISLLLLPVAAACTPHAKSTAEVLGNIEEHAGKRVVMEVELQSGARCRVGQGPDDFKTYCKDCQWCIGPLVVQSSQPTDGELDWPMTLGGTHAGKPIRCEGPLNEVKCHPFELGKKYVIRGSIEKTTPPKLLVSEFWEP